MSYKLLIVLELETSIAEPGPPIIVEHPSDIIVAKGDSATLTCKATSNPSPTVVWYKDGSVLSTSKDESSSHRVLLPDGSLFILKVAQGKSIKSDAGKYWCIARNAYGQAESKQASLKIAHLRDEFRVNPKAVQVVTGGQAMIECTPPKGYPEPAVYWKKDGRNLDLKGNARYAVKSDGNLLISKVQKADSGFYSCVAENIASTVESTAARLSVYEKPKIVTAPTDHAVDVGSNAIFVCRMSGDPNPVVSWRKKDGRMPEDRAKVLDDHTLSIREVVPSDEGEYVCSGKNPAGKAEASAKLVVQSPPWFVEQPSDVEVKEGKEAVLRCEASGNPAPSQFWSKEGVQHLMFPGYKSSDERIVVSQEGSLIIRQVAASDEAYYVCTALNEAGSNSAKAIVRVNPDDVVKRLPPLISRGPANQTLPTESLVIMPCSVKSVGQNVDIFWMKDFVRVHTDSRFNILPGGNLEIRALKVEDTGTYICKAEGTNGEDHVYAFLRVEAPTKANVAFERMPEPSTFPSAPGTPQAINVSDTTVMLRWNPPAKMGASPVNSYRIQYYSPELGRRWISVFDFIRSPFHLVSMLRPSSAYVFVVRASNNHGTSEPSSFSAVVRTKSSSLVPVTASGVSPFEPELVSDRLNDRQIVRLYEPKPINDTAVELSWTLLRSEVPLTSFYVRWQASDFNQQGWTNVSVSTGQTDWTLVVGQLNPFTTYKFFVTPFFHSIEGNPSNIMEVTTAEAVPSAPPRDVQVRMTNLTTVRISWKPPLREEVKGILRGYQVVVIANYTFIQRNLTIKNEKATGVTLFYLKPGFTYHIRVAAFTSAGVGQKYSENVVVMDEATLKSHLARDSMSTANGRLKALVQEPWFISSIGATLWALLVIIVGLVWWRRRRLYNKSVEGGTTGPFIKINDGSVLNSAREALWIDPQQFYAVNGPHPGTVSLAPLSTGYLAGSQSPSYGRCLTNDGRAVLMNLSNRQLDKPYTELSQLNYGPGSRAPSNSYYHQILMDGEYNSSPYYRKTSPPSPTPYATTTLVMNAHRQRTGQMGNNAASTFGGHRHQGMQIPERELGSLNTKERDRPLKRAGSSMVSELTSNNNSPPHTDVSFLSGGTSSGSSANSRKCRSQQPILLDFLPPPPTQPPPPVMDNDVTVPSASISMHRGNVQGDLAGQMKYSEDIEGRHSPADERLSHPAQANSRLPNSDAHRPASHRPNRGLDQALLF
ncbi:roundabout 2 [Trichuris trichiura]|uniref:Roundabout 2 n=1 Tax=Trichuris trichiura TaxID=36087 RepID=A0A077Z3H0_TRITR|nr:roundabout 2 [Trichuris trichiura]